MQVSGTDGGSDRSVLLRLSKARSHAQPSAQLRLPCRRSARITSEAALVVSIRKHVPCKSWCSYRNLVTDKLCPSYKY